MDPEDIIDELFDNQEEEQKEETPAEKPAEKPDDKPDDKPEDKKEEKKEDKPLAALPPVDADNLLDVAFQAGRIAQTMERELRKEFKGQLDDAEIGSIMDQINASGVKNIANYYNAKGHQKLADIAVANKRREGKLDDRKVNRDTTSVGGGSAKSKPQTVGDSIVSRFNDPKLTEFFKKKGAIK